MDNENAKSNSHLLINDPNDERSLPFEILSEIFSYLASESPLQLRHALFVARSWHDAAVYSPNLWATILIDRTFFPRCRGRWLARGEAFIRCCFIRSRDLPITISVQYQRNRIDHAILKEAFSSTVIGRLLGSVGHCHTKRCKALTWVSDDPTVDAYALSEIFPSQLDMLEYLSLEDFISNHFDEASSALRFPHCPNLKEVSLTNYCEGYLLHFFRDEDLERVEKLTFGNTSSWMVYDILCISRYRNIHTLVLRDGGGNSLYGLAYGEGPAAGSTLAHLPHLKALLAIGCIPEYILESIRAPGLLSLRLETDEEANHTLGTIPTTLLTTLHSIDISFRLLPMAPWVPPLRLVVSKAPHLSRLFITEWMKDDLEREDWYRQLDILCHFL